MGDYAVREYASGYIDGCYHLVLTKANTATPAAILPVLVTVTRYTRVGCSSSAVATAWVVLAVSGGSDHRKRNVEYDRPYPNSYRGVPR